MEFLEIINVGGGVSDRAIRFLARKQWSGNIDRLEQRMDKSSPCKGLPLSLATLQFKLNMWVNCLCKSTLLKSSVTGRRGE